MLYSNGFIESRTNKIHLPGKNHSEIIELLKCIYPNILKPIDNNNVSYLLPLADEYSILILRKQIERFYISTINSFTYKYGDNLTRLFDLLKLCEIYRLNQFERVIWEHLTDHFDVQHWNTSELSADLRCHLFEIFVRKQEIKLKDRQTKIKQLEDLTVKQKFEIQRLKNELNNN